MDDYKVRIVDKMIELAGYLDSRNPPNVIIPSIEHMRDILQLHHDRRGVLDRLEGQVHGQ